MRAVTVNAAWPAANEIAAGATPVTRMAGGRSTHSTVVFVPTASTMTAPTTMPTTVPSTARTTLWPVLSALERSTESVPRTTQNACSARTTSATSTAPASAGRAPEAVVQPGRVTVEVRCRALAGHGEQVGDARRRSPEELIEPAASLGRHRALRVGGDLRDGVADLLGAEARVQRGRRSGGRRCASRTPRARRARPRASRRRRAGRPAIAPFRPAAPRSGRAPSPRRAPPPGRWSRRRGASIASRRGPATAARRPSGGSPGPPFPGRRAGTASRRTRGAVPRRRRPPPSAPLPRRRSANPRHAPTIASRKGSAAGAGHRSVIARSEPAAAMPHPMRGSTGEDTSPRLTGRMKASRSDVVAPASTELTTPENRTANPTIAIDATDSHTVPATSASGDDEHRAGDGERDLRLEPPAHRAGEVDQQQHRERAEGGEDRHDRVADDLLADREGRGHGDRRARGAAQRHEAAVVLPQPAERLSRQAPDGEIIAAGEASGLVDRVQDGPAGELGAPPQARLVADPREVVLHRARRDVDLLGDLLVRQALGDEAQHLVLGGGELRADLGALAAGRARVRRAAGGRPARAR